MKKKYLPIDTAEVSPQLSSTSITLFSQDSTELTESGDGVSPGLQA
jgi:hypothetical protein